MASEVERLQAKLTAQENLRLAERAELVASYEGMLAEQVAAVQQFEAKAESVGPLRSELRWREAEINRLSTSGASERQYLFTVLKVWRASMGELEGALDTQ
eukprot:542696-Prymnesium_polylepis.1